MMIQAPAKFVWHDLMTPDMDAAQKFYSEVIGWEIVDAGMPDGNYRILNVGKPTPDGMGGVAGMMGFRPEDDKSIPLFWSGYIYTADVSATAQQAVKLGGKIFREPAIVPDTVEFAILLDPDGALFNILRPLRNEPSHNFPTGTPGTIGWNELHANNWQQAWTFYSTMFGWQKHQAVDMGPMGTYQTFGIADVSFGGMMNRQPNIPQPCWLYYWNVDSIDAAAARTEAAGGKVLLAPHQVPGGSWIFNAIDPQGGTFAAVSLNK